MIEPRDVWQERWEAACLQLDEERTRAEQAEALLREAVRLVQCSRYRGSSCWAEREVGLVSTPCQSCAFLGRPEIAEILKGENND